MTETVVLALIGLTVTIAVHITIIARWSGRIDSYMQTVMERIERVDEEILRLRNARHDSDGVLQRHEGTLHDIELRLASEKRLRE